MIRAGEVRVMVGGNDLVTGARWREGQGTGNGGEMVNSDPMKVDGENGVHFIKKLVGTKVV